MALPPQFLNNANKKHKYDTKAQDAKETPAQHAHDIAIGKDRPDPKKSSKAKDKKHFLQQIASKKGK